MLPLKDWANPQQLAHAAQDIRAAVALVDQRGWCRRVSELDTGPLCAGRAIGVVTGVHDWDSWAGRTVIALGAVYRVHGKFLVSINDESDTWTDVRAKMLDVAGECDRAAQLGDVSA